MYASLPSTEIIYTANLQISGLPVILTIIPLPVFLTEHSSANPKIILGAVIGSGFMVTALLVAVSVVFRRFMVAKANGLLVLEREK